MMYNSSLGRVRRARRRGVRGLGLLEVSPDLMAGAVFGVIGMWIALKGLKLPFTKKAKAS